MMLLCNDHQQQSEVWLDPGYKFMTGAIAGLLNKVGCEVVPPVGIDVQTVEAVSQNKYLILTGN